MKTLCALLLFLSFCSFGQTLKSFHNGPVKLYYEEYGSGPVLYILAVGPGESPDHPYRQIVDSLKSYYTCVLLHQRGSGKSRNIPINESTISIQHNLRDIELLQKERDDKKVTAGGFVGWVTRHELCSHSSLISQ